MIQTHPCRYILFLVYNPLGRHVFLRHSSHMTYLLNESSSFCSGSQLHTWSHIQKDWRQSWWTSRDQIGCSRSLSKSKGIVTRIGKRSCITCTQSLFLEIDHIIKLKEFQSFEKQLRYYGGPNKSKTYRLLYG